jgi:hypothetical protein
MKWMYRDGDGDGDGANAKLVTGYCTTSTLDMAVLGCGKKTGKTNGHHHILGLA